MSRSLKKGPFTDPKLMKKISKLRPGDKAVVKTWARSSMITPEMVGFTIGVHNGKIHVPVSVVENMVGHRLADPQVRAPRRQDAEGDRDRQGRDRRRSRPGRRSGR